MKKHITLNNQSIINIVKQHQPLTIAPLTAVTVPPSISAASFVQLPVSIPTASNNLLPLVKPSLTRETQVTNNKTNNAEVLSRKEYPVEKIEANSDNCLSFEPPKKNIIEKSVAIDNEKILKAQIENYIEEIKQLKQALQQLELNHQVEIKQLKQALVNTNINDTTKNTNRVLIINEKEKEDFDTLESYPPTPRASQNDEDPIIQYPGPTDQISPIISPNASQMTAYEDLADHHSPLSLTPIKFSTNKSSSSVDGFVLLDVNGSVDDSSSVELIGENEHITD